MKTKQLKILQIILTLVLIVFYYFEFYKNFDISSTSTIIFISIILGIIISEIETRVNHPINQGNKHLLKKRKPDYIKIIIIGSALFKISFGNSNDFNMIFYSIIIILIIPLIRQIIFKNNYPNHYLIINPNSLTFNALISTTIKFKKIKFVELFADCLIIYQNWSKYKIVFDKFENSEILRNDLISMLNRNNVQIKEQMQRT